MYNPFDVTIQNQADDEDIVKVWRHHPITFVWPALRVMAFALVPILLVTFTGFSMFDNLALAIVFFIILAVVVTYAAYEWISWYGDVYILTNYRLIDVEQRGFFHRRFVEAPLSRIQDISFEISGFLQSLFNYGNVVVQTAGSEANLTLDSLRDPQRQNIYILQKQQEFLKGQDQSLSAEDLIKLLAKHRKDLDKLAKQETAEAAKQREDQLKRAKETKAKKRRRKRAS